MGRRSRCAVTVPPGAAPRLLLLAAALALAGAAVPAAPSELDDLLARRDSPGVLALLAEHAADPRVQERLATALEAPEPATRAAAARVIHAASRAELAVPLRAALDRESDAGAWGEMARAALVLSPADEALVETLLASELRAADAVADALGRTRGSRAVWEHGARLRADDADLVLIRAASWDPATHGLAASAALRDGDPEAWATVLRLAREPGATLLPGGVLRSALGHEDASVRTETLFHLATTVGGPKPPDPELRAELDAILATRPTADGRDRTELFALELVARALGVSTPDADAWAPWLASDDGAPLRDRFLGSAVFHRFLGSPTLVELLGSRERRALDLDEVFRPRVTVQGSPSPGVVRAVSDFPAGYVSDLLRVTGCRGVGLSGVPRHACRAATATARGLEPG